MKSMFQFVGKCVGKQFAPDNCMVPVMRMDRFHRLAGPGYFQINPFIEKTLNPVSIGLRVGEFRFHEIHSQDNIPFTVKLTLLYRFNPKQLDLNVVSQVVRLTPKKIEEIVRNYTSQGLRRLASLYPAAELSSNEALSTIERNLAGFLRGHLYPLGLIPLRQGGILIKETIPPDKFKQTMLQVRQHKVTMEALGQYQDRLNEMAIQAQFLAGLESFKGNLALVSSLEGLSSASLQSMLNVPNLQMNPNSMRTNA